MSDHSPCIMVNHVGFNPKASKRCVVKAPPEPAFAVYRLKDTVWSRVCGGELRQAGEELGPAWTGDFSAVAEEGIYQVRCGELRSRGFVVQRGAYDIPRRVVFNYFPWQRCGDSRTGWHAPCHLEDGRIEDTGERIDLTGGYHQSGDLRKWSQMVNIGLIGLARAGSGKAPSWDRGQFAEEIRWGSDYYLKIIVPDGGILDSAFIPLGWGGRDYYLQDAPAPAHWNCIRHLALVAEYFAGRDPGYSRLCEKAARRVWTHMFSDKGPRGRYAARHLPPRGHDGLDTWYSGFYEGSALDLSHRLCAGIELYRLTNEDVFLEEACRSATLLAGLQVGRGESDESLCGACFWEGQEGHTLVNSHFYYWHTSGPVGLADIIALRKDHPDAGKWMSCALRIAEQYRRVSERNPWGRVPARWFGPSASPIVECFSASTEDGDREDRHPGGALPSRGTPGAGLAATYAYCPNIYNLDLMGIAIFLRRMAALTGVEEYSGIAQRQLDWLMGCNPWDASSIEGVGYNQPHRGIFGEFFPPTPQIPGGISLGITRRSMEPGSYALDNEYDMPGVGWALWLLSDLVSEPES